MPPKRVQKKRLRRVATKETSEAFKQIGDATALYIDITESFCEPQRSARGIADRTELDGYRRTRRAPGTKARIDYAS